VDKIKEFRNQKGWTQSELAERAGLSLRTIQRIESGQSILKGHTLQVLSKVIGINPAEFFETDGSLISEEQIERLKFINLSALAIVIIPFGNIIFPFIVWRRGKEDPVLNRTVKYILNFQIIWSLWLSFLLIISPFIQNFLGLDFSLIIVVLVLGYCFNVWMIFKFSKWITKGDLESLRITYQLW